MKVTVLTNSGEMVYSGVKKSDRTYNIGYRDKIIFYNEKGLSVGSVYTDTLEAIKYEEDS